jgi:hypothetical protein
MGERRNYLAISWGIFYLLLWIYRSVVSLLGQSVVAQLTSLGDSQSYQDTGYTFAGALNIWRVVSQPRVLATQWTDILGGMLNLVGRGNPIFVNLGFQTVAFIGIVALLRQVEPRARLLLAALLALPSFTLWSSVASKDAVVVFAVGIFGAFIAQRYRTGHARLTPLFLFALLLIAVYRNQYLPAVTFLLIGTYACEYVQQKAFLALVGGLASLFALLLVQDQFSALAFSVVHHFDGGITRPPFWNSASEVLSSAPYGMFISFFGPTWDEAGRGVLQMAAFVESTIIVGILFLLLIRGLPRMPIYSLLIAGFSLFWILLANYPLGVMNSGTAIRYRTGYLPLIAIIVVAVMSRRAYAHWTNGRKPAELSVQNPLA